MSGVLLKVRSLYRTLPNAEKSVAKYVMENPVEAPFKTVRQVAEKSNVSVASVSRFAQKLGFANFKNFRVELARDSSDLVTNLYNAVTPVDSDAEIIRKVFLGQIKSLEDTMKILNIKDLIHAMQAIVECRRIVFFGVGSSGNIAHDAALRFCYIGSHADAYSDASQILLHASRAEPDTVVVGISHSGRSTVVVQGLQIAAKNRAKTIGISNYSRSPLHDACEVFFCTAFTEDRVKVAALSSEIAQVCLIDALVLLTAKHSKQMFDPEEVNNLTEKLLRIQE